MMTALKRILVSTFFLLVVQCTISYSENSTIDNERMPIQNDQKTLPLLVVSPSTFTLGMNLSYGWISVSNVGSGTMTWTPQVISGADWLWIQSYNGINSGGLLFGYLTNTLIPARSGVIRISANGAPGSPVDVTINQVGHLPISIPVPDTGQSKCYDKIGNVITCPSTLSIYNFYGQDANYNINTPSFTKLDANGNDLSDSATSWSMVRDNVTRLIWEIKTTKDGVKNYNDPHDADNTYTWYNPTSTQPGTPGDETDTSDFLNRLNEMSYGGYNDWRLPSYPELNQLVNFNIGGGGITAVFSDYFNATLAQHYWSSDVCTWSMDNVWVAGFNGATGCYAEKSHSLPVRAVRGKK